MKTPEYFAHPTAVVEAGAVVGRGVRIWHFSHVLAGSVIGTDCVIGQNVMIGPRVRIGDGCKIQNNVSVYEGVTLEDEVFCGPSVVFTNVRVPRAFIDRKKEFMATRVERGASLGANATILCGTTIGSYAMVAAGAVVTKDVPSYALMVGSPARFRGWVGRSGERLDAAFVCPRTKERYRVQDGNLVPER
ncbi:MAG TPA: acyltransferase [Rhizomicrobium sp.]